MKRFFRHFAFAAFGVSILCLALGIAMLIWTATAMKWISYGFGAVMILSGILQIASYLTGERVGLLRKLLLISGIIAAVAGVWILLTQSLAEQVMRLTASTGWISKAAKPAAGRRRLCWACASVRRAYCCL